MNNVVPFAADQDQPAGPFNHDVERAVVGSILADNEQYFEVARCLRAEDFSHPVHRRLFEAVGARIEAGGKIDVTLLRASLGDAGLADGAHGRYVTELFRHATASYLAPSYARWVHAAARWREAHDEIALLFADAERAIADGTPGEALDRAEAALDKLRAKDQARNATSIHEALTAAIERVDHAMQAPDGIVGIPSGIADLDRLTGGFQPTDLIILAARPSMGKTSLAISFAKAAAAQRRGVLFISCEQSAVQVAIRFSADLAFDRGARFSYSDMLNGRATDGEFRSMIEMLAPAVEHPILIETEARSVSGIRAAARSSRSFFSRFGVTLDLIVVDYLGLLQDSGRQSNRTDQVGEISAGLKRLAMDLNIPVIALSQLSRAVESREDKRPMLSDLRASGDIEQDADVVMFLFREAYYLGKREPEPGSAKWSEWQSRMDHCRNVAEIIVAKQRMGPTDTVRAMCHIECNAFRDLARGGDDL